MAQLGKYQLVAEIARGGMGIVYLAIARGPARFSKLLVVKQLKPELVEDPSFLDMFLEEARLAARLNHPNIVQTYEIGSDDNRHFMVMDYLEGVTLARTLRRKNASFTLGMHLRVICETLQGLHYAHTLSDFDGTPLGIVHRDATPQNVFITYDGQVKLVDFGIAKALDSTVETSTGVLKGKPSYMAPEQIAGDVDARADVFTAGVMIWEAVAGRRMWHKKGDVEILTNIIKGDVPSLSEAAPDAPAQIVRIVEKALTKQRDERYASASDLQNDLEGYLVTSGTNVSMREVAKVVQEIFATERQAVKATIETHLQGLKQGNEDAKLPSLRPPPAGEPGTDGNTPVNESQPSLVSKPNSLTPGMGRTPPGTEMPTGATPVSMMGQPNGSRGKLIGAVAAIAIVAVIAVVVATRKGGEPVATPAKTDPMAQPTQPAAAAAPQPAAASTPTTHEVNLRAYPKNAVLTIDGAEVSNPVKKTCSHGKPFSVHASSPGHVSVDRTLRCETDESIELALTSQPAAPFTPPPPQPPTKGAKAPIVPTPHTAEAAPAPTPTTKPATPGEVNPSGGTKPNRPIDTSSPYNQ